MEARCSKHIRHDSQNTKPKSFAQPGGLFDVEQSVHNYEHETNSSSHDDEDHNKTCQCFLGKSFQMLIPYSFGPKSYASPAASNSSLELDPVIGIRETVLLAIANCINNISSGVAAGLSNCNIPITVFLTIMTSWVFLYIGQFLGQVISDVVPKSYISTLAGVSLIVLGLSNIGL